ncbi:Sorting nexin mvp1 [Serendipita sp. 400]|nr:Sorting nexin mvp1 [Serendipita sp. 400]
MTEVEAKLLRKLISSSASTRAMFNVARSPQTRYDSLNGFQASFVADPLAASVYDNDVDPWSGVATPTHPEPTSEFSSILGNAQIPPVYAQTFTTMDTLGTGTVSINSLQRVISTSGLPAATIEQIINLVSSKSRVSRGEFYVALALVGLAQQDQGISIENVAKLAQQNELPVPSLDASALAAIGSSTVKSSFPPPRPGPVYNPDPDPWTLPSKGTWSGGSPIADAGHATASIISSGLPPHWWKGQEQVTVSIHGQQGLFFNRFTVYSVQSYSRGPAVQRRYSEFVFLWDCLVRRYPFRILPQLPPKRIGPDENFIEQRRKGLARFLNFVVNHPVIKDDGVLSVFLSEPDFDGWKRRTPISYDEEATTKRVDRNDEMSIPGNLEEKLAATRQKIGTLIEQWTRLCTITERVLKRRETGSADIMRATLTLNALTEGSSGNIWGLPDSSLAAGVRIGVENVSGHLNSLADSMEQRSRVAVNSNLEALKTQRDLYVAVRDLFARHDRYSPDAVERLKKRVETQSLKLEGIKKTQKEGWENEAEKIAASISKDQAAITACMARRVFIRHWCDFSSSSRLHPSPVLAHSLSLSPFLLLFCDDGDG